MASLSTYSGPRTETQPVSIWQPMRRPLFFALWIAGFVSNIGTWMQNVAASWLMTSLTSSHLMVALIQTFSRRPGCWLPPASSLSPRSRA